MIHIILSYISYKLLILFTILKWRRYGNLTHMMDVAKLNSLRIYWEILYDQK